MTRVKDSGVGRAVREVEVKSGMCLEPWKSPESLGTPTNGDSEFPGGRFTSSGDVGGWNELEA